MKRQLKEFIKCSIYLLCSLIVLPLVAVFKLTKSKFIFVSISELLAMIPDIFGSSIRIAFYSWTLKKCSRKVIFIGFGTIFTQPDAELEDGVFVSGYCVIGNVLIKEHAGLACNVHVLSGRKQHVFEDLDKPFLQQESGKLEKIIIGRNCWVGECSTIMANIGKSNIIGAGSVVIKDTDDYKVVVGNPARVIRDRRQDQPASTLKPPVEEGTH